MLLDIVAGWQTRARAIVPPEESGILPAVGGLCGSAFFPEGIGLQNPSPATPFPEIIAIGHNFGCEDYRKGIEGARREDDKPTWRNLCQLLSDAGLSMQSCYMTNWFVGLQPGNKQVGDFLTRPDARYEHECEQLLVEQIRTLTPKVVLLLGLPVVKRAYRIMPELQPWADAANWSAVDSSSLGPVAYGVEIPGTRIKSNVVALLHPSLSPSNQRYRRSVFAVEMPEVEMIKTAMNRVVLPYASATP